MIDRGKRNILGIEVSATDYDAVVCRVCEAACEGRPLAVTALAVHGLMLGALNRELKFQLNRLDLVVPDGQPIKWALNWLYRTELTDRVYGPALTLKICAAAQEHGLPVYFYGTTAEILKHLTSNLKRSFPNLRIAGAEPSKFRPLSVKEKSELIARIRRCGARIAFVGIGCPRQEQWVFEFRHDLQMPLLAVGAAFAFHAGILAQAPRWMQEAGLEWLFRFSKEPRRLWSRYLLLNPAYVGMVLLQLMGASFATEGQEPAYRVIPG
jgi:exopolysaccharide biosynthesis WecB/TagA/CpsF family protein